MENFTDIELCLLWNLTNLSTHSLSKVFVAEEMTHYSDFHGVALWSRVNEEVKARELNPVTFTKTVKTVVTTEECL